MPQVMSENLDFRRIAPDDSGFMEQMVYEAATSTRSDEPAIDDILQIPRFRLFYEDWGQRGDYGIIARLNDADAGATWYREIVLRDGDLADFSRRTFPRHELIIGIDKEHRSKGLGTLLLEKLVAEAGENGVDGLLLTVNHEHTVARSLYQKVGFRVVAANHLMGVMVLD